MRKLLAILFATTAALQGGTIVVTDSIGEALQRAGDGDTLQIAGPATYQEEVVIRKSVRVAGVNSPVISGSGRGTVILIQAPNVTLQGLIVRGSGTNLATFDSGIRIEGEGAIIEGCRIESDGFGIYIRGADNSVLKENVISSSKTPKVATRGNGVHLWKTKGNQIIGNNITGKRDGIYLSYADHNFISENKVTHSRFGIHYMYSHFNKLMSNSLTANTVGATLMFARHCTVQGNKVYANKRHGILLKQLESSRVIGNFISGHNRGLFVQQAAQDRFESNIISNNDIGLYLSSGSEQNVFVGNDFVQNVDQVWQPQDEVERGRLAANAFFENRRGNFWSDYTGADRNHDGAGDTPYYETDIYGYILDRHPEARIFALSPAAALLRKGEELLPLINTAGVTDLFPLMTPVSKSHAWLSNCQYTAAK